MVVFLFVVLLSCPTGVYAIQQPQLAPQNSELNTSFGRPYLNLYTREEGKNVPMGQFWSVTQDKNGVMYFGTVGVKVFDGATWQTIPSPNNTRILSLAYHTDDKLYLGTQREFGFMAPDVQGSLTYHSLLPLLSPEDAGFEEIRHTISTSFGVFFQAYHYLYLWKPDTNLDQGGSLQVIYSESGFGEAFSISGIPYFRIPEKGLVRWNNNTLELVPGGEFLAHMSVEFIIPSPAISANSPSLILGTKTQGLFTYDGLSFKLFSLNMMICFDRVLLATALICLTEP